MIEPTGSIIKGIALNYQIDHVRIRRDRLGAIPSDPHMVWRYNALATASQNSVVLDLPPWSGVRKRPSA